MYTASNLARLLVAIEDDGCGLSWAPYRDACADYSVHGLGMPDSLAHYHGVAIGTRWKREGLPIPRSLVPDTLPK